jgi:hypothetical protein
MGGPRGGRAVRGLNLWSLTIGIVGVAGILGLQLGPSATGLAKPSPDPRATVGDLESPKPAPSSTAALADQQLSPLAAPLDLAPDPRLLYGYSPDGSWAAYRDVWSGPGLLHLVARDGIETDLNIGPVEELAPQAVAFSPDGLAMAVVDGAGGLWTVDLRNLQSTEIALGDVPRPILGRSLHFADAEHLVVNVVGSVAIPIPSRLAVVNLGDSTVTYPSDDLWAYGPFALADGSILYQHLNDDGTYLLRRLSVDGSVNDVFQLGTPEWVDVSPNGTVAFANQGTVYVLEQGSAASPIGVGNYPRLSQYGQALAYYDVISGIERLVSLTGTILDSSDSPFVAITIMPEVTR